MKKLFFTLLIINCSLLISKAQSVGIGTTTPNASAALEVKSTTKGLLMPVMTTGNRTAIPSPAKGLLVYDSTAKAFYYYDGIQWNGLFASNTADTLTWKTTGNAGTTGNNFIGTTDYQPINFKVNNLPAGKLDSLNTFLGYKSGIVNNGLGNTALGRSTLLLNTTGAGNTALGYETLSNNTNGGKNTANGYNALNYNNADNNTATGYEALRYNTTGTSNTAYGANALWTNITGNSNIAFGASTLFSNNTGTHNVAIGDSSLYSNNGNYNTSVGFKSLYSNTTGNYNTANGNGALYNNTTGYYNTANGSDALYRNTTGYLNTANGSDALYSNTTGWYNTANGSFALNNNTTGYYNTANGNSALSSNTTGDDNTANGNVALYSNTTGYNNTANGNVALYSNTTGYNNTANGSDALYNNTTGYYNTANGNSALSSNTTGNYNTANGNSALYNNTTGNYNTANGSDALSSNTTGNNITSIGHNSDVGSNNLTNATAIGAYARVDISNALVLGSIAGVNGATASTNVGIGNSTPHAPLQFGNTLANRKIVMWETANNDNDYFGFGINGATLRYNIPSAATGNNQHSFYAGPTLLFNILTNGNATLAGTLSTGSDIRLKKNIQPLQNSLSNLLNLKGYTYNWIDSTKDKTQQIGVLAQEIQKIYPELVKEDEKGMLSVNYMGLTPVLIESIKELNKKLEDQQTQNELLLKRLEAIESKIKN